MSSDVTVDGPAAVTVQQAPPPAAPLRRAFQIPIVVALVLGFGGLVFLAVTMVLALGTWSARETTISLLRDKSQAALQQIDGGIALYMRPIESELVEIARQIESGHIDLQRSDLGTFFAGALTATPEVRSLVFIQEDGKMLRALRSGDRVEVTTIDVLGMPVIRSALEAARGRNGLFYGEIVRPETANIPVVNLRHPVHVGGRYVGLLAATVQTDRLSELLHDVAGVLHGTAFILYDGRVLAHPQMVRGAVRSQVEFLPTLAEMGDPVVEAVGRIPFNMMARDVAARAGIQLLTVEDRQYALLSRSLDRYGDKPWLVGVYFPAADLLEELGRLRWAAIAGVIVLLGSLAVAYFYARYFTAPLLRLSHAAESVRALSFDRVERLPVSLFSEVNAAGQAFNSMVTGLRWFETYVPRKLVQRLVGASADAAPMESKERQVTVMFTDIVGFTTMSQDMKAQSVATVLNCHFALVTAAIEAEGGTVDKFIGDSVMAFWNAPEKQKDHAARACRAAQAIALAVRRENAAARMRREPALSMRIGLHTGPVVVGNIGAPGRINYTIVGDTVNTANRFEQLGKTLSGEGDEVTVMLSGVTLKAAGGQLPVKSVGAVTVRGRHGEIDAYLLQV